MRGVRGDAEDSVSGAQLLILMSLAPGPKHGHALMKDVERFSSVHLGPGTLYKSLSRLEGLELIEALSPDDRRRPYAITAAGCRALARSVEHMSLVVNEGRKRLKQAGLAPGVS